MALENLFRKCVDLIFKYIYYITKKTYRHILTFSFNTIVKLHSWTETQILKSKQLAFMVYTVVDYIRTRGSLALAFTDAYQRTL
jgi:hypothetical protein